MYIRKAMLEHAPHKQFNVEITTKINLIILIFNLFQNIIINIEYAIIEFQSLNSPISMFNHISFMQKAVQELFMPKLVHYNKTDIYNKIQEQNKLNVNHSKINFKELSRDNDQNLPNGFLLWSHSVKDQNFRQRAFSTLNKSDNLPKNCIIYIHGYSSYSMEGLYLMPFLNKYHDFSLCLYDIRCHGKSSDEGPITFGIEESKQLFNLILYLKNLEKIQHIILWGRSMGATTCLNLIFDDQNKYSLIRDCVKLVIVDSAFTSFKSIAQQTINSITNNALPTFLIDIFVQNILKIAQEKFSINLRSLDLINKMNQVKKQQVYPKTVFISSDKDEIIPSSNTLKLLQAYPCVLNQMKCTCKLINGNFSHNEPRPEYIIEQVFQFAKNYVFLTKNINKSGFRKIGFKELINEQIRQSKQKMYKKGIKLCSSTVQRNKSINNEINKYQNYSAAHIKYNESQIENDTQLKKKSSNFNPLLSKIQQRSKKKLEMTKNIFIQSKINHGTGQSMAKVQNYHKNRRFTQKEQISIKLSNFSEKDSRIKLNNQPYIRHTYQKQNRFPVQPIQSQNTSSQLYSTHKLTPKYINKNIKIQHSLRKQNQ